MSKSDNMPSDTVSWVDVLSLFTPLNFGLILVKPLFLEKLFIWIEGSYLWYSLSLTSLTCSLMSNFVSLALLNVIAPSAKYSFPGVSTFRV